MDSSHHNANEETDEDELKPQTRLELSVNPTDGSLLTAPLSLIINTATDALYNDLYNMATGQPLTFYLPSSEERDSGMPYTENSAAMSSLSFQQRRHILASRIARHVQSLSHASALVASSLPTSASISNARSGNAIQPNIYAQAQIPPENELSQITQAASQALEHVRTSWVSADTAQDALYFHHDSLWKIRSHPHDVLGSAEVLLKGRWKDLSRDVKLEDRYRDSVERSWSKEETKERLRAVVRRKLVLGEIGRMSKERPSFKWNVVLENDGMVVRLTYGNSRIEGDSKVHPLEARVTVLSEQNPAPWSLLSIRIKTAVKTGESNHQLDLSKEQMFGFHKICERAMMQEEIRAGKFEKDETGKKKEDNVSRPLEKLLYMSHVFSLSWQMEILSSQAEALRKGTWSNQGSSVGGDYSGISVTPVHFYQEEEQASGEYGDRLKPLAYMAIHFWEVDDRNGKPKIGSLLEDKDGGYVSSEVPSLDKNVSSKLTLEIRAVPSKGLEVSLSGGNETRGDNAHLKRNVKQLLSSLQDPFQLSVSDALLSAVVICAERRCIAVMKALTKMRPMQTSDSANGSVLPSWLHLRVECGSISFGIRLSYDGTDESQRSVNEPAVLFRVACDSRSGKFVATFPRAMSLLRRLACNETSASEVQLLRQIKSTTSSSSSADKRRAAARARESSGRSVRDAFLSLTRSLDILGKRVGVGSEWEDKDPEFSPALRERSIEDACGDVCTSLMSCAGIAAVYGVGALAVGVSGGTNPLPEIGGGAITEKVNDAELIPVPPLCVIMNQELVERKEVSMNGENSTVMKLEREMCGITASVSEASVTLYLFEIVAQVDSITSPPNRVTCARLPMESSADVNDDGNLRHVSKRRRLADGIEGSGSEEGIMPFFNEVDYFAKMLTATWEKMYA